MSRLNNWFIDCLMNGQTDWHMHWVPNELTNWLNHRLRDWSSYITDYPASRGYIFAVWAGYFSHASSYRENLASARRVITDWPTNQWITAWKTNWPNTGATDWLIHWLTGEAINRSIHWLAGWWPNRLTTNWIAELTDWLISLSTDWLLSHSSLIINC